MKTLEDYRREIDAVDEKIVSALAARFALTDEVRAFKRAHGLAARDEAREREIIAKALAHTSEAERDTVFGVYEKIFGGSRGVIETVARGVCIRNGRVLLCKAKGAKPTYLPGGHVEFGETGAEALVREVKEETGFAARSGQMLGVVENRFLQQGKQHCEINLVYAFDLEESGMKVDELRAQEDWIEFVWWPVARIDEAGLLPADMIGCVKCCM